MNEKILSDLQSDYTKAKASKQRVDSRIQKWVRAYNGDKIGNEVKGRSSFVVKDVMKLIKSMSPSIIEPFIASNSMIKAKAKNTQYLGSESLWSDILNHTYNYDFDKLGFIRRMSYILPKEGTAWIRTYWDFEEKVTKEKFRNVGAEVIAMMQDQGLEIEAEENKDDTYTGSIINRTTLKNHANSMIVKNESVFPDPTAETPDDIQFIIYEYEKSFSDIKKESNIYNKLEDIDLETLENSLFPDTALGGQRYQDNINSGRDYSFSPSARSQKKVKILEYWGEYDIDGDGINEQIVCSWVKDSNTILRIEENPFPDKEIPFIPVVFDEEPFSLWGNGLAEIIGDNQNLHTAIMRGFIENMSLANNGQKLIQKGSIDYVNMAKLNRGDKYVEVNNIDGIRDGSYNQIPQSSFGIYEMLTQESELLSGVNRYLEGIDNATIGRTSSGINMVMSAAQRHMSILVNVIADAYEKMFTKWYKYSQAMIDDGQMFQIAGQLAEVRKEELQGEYRINVKVVVDAMNQQKVGQINTLMQQVQAVGDKLPPQVMPLLVAEVFDAFGKNEEANSIRTYEPQPDPVAQEAQRVELEKLKLENEKIKAEIEEIMAKIDKSDAETLNALGEDKDDRSGKY